MSIAVLAYTGSLTTTVAIHWLRYVKNMNVIAFTADTGQGMDLSHLAERALNAGALAAHIIDLKKEFAENYLLPVLHARAVYENGYLLGQALTRPLIAREMAKLAQQEGAHFIAHGCSTKGNDQIRFETTVATIMPHLETIAPMREWKMKTREELVAYAELRDITIYEPRERQHNSEVCLWGSVIRLPETMDPWEKVDNSVFCMTRSNTETPNEPKVFELEFKDGIPIALDGERMNLVETIQTLNNWGGEHGIGRIDTIENRMTGMKTREVYEAPGATILHAAHRALEDINLSRNILHFKWTLSDRYAELVYEGLWFSEIRMALDAFFQSYQKYITGTVKIKLHHATCHIVGRKSPYSQYDLKQADQRFFDPLRQQAAEGFMTIHKLPQLAEAKIRKHYEADHPKE